MPSTLPIGSNPFLILLAIIKSPNLTVSDVDKLQVLAKDFAGALSDLADTQNTLQQLADEIDLGDFEYSGDSNALRVYAETLRALRLNLKDFLADVFDEKVTSNSKMEARHD